ncbi:hypothetical protein KAI87_11750, partial [Myxococcota bacterium]|nr:hypothetical protein [Myxococcota bacterium]
MMATIITAGNLKVIRAEVAARRVLCIACEAHAWIQPNALAEIPLAQHAEWCSDVHALFPPEITSLDIQQWASKLGQRGDEQYADPLFGDPKPTADPELEIRSLDLASWARRLDRLYRHITGGFNEVIVLADYRDYDSHKE